MADNIMTRRTHEAAPAHKAAVEERLREQRLGVSKARRGEERAASDMARLDAAAKVAYAADVAARGTSGGGGGAGGGGGGASPWTWDAAAGYYVSAEGYYYDPTRCARGSRVCVRACVRACVCACACARISQPAVARASARGRPR